MYRAAIIGTGRVAGLLEDDVLREHPCTHAGLYNSRPDIDLCAVAGKSAKELNTFADKFSIKEKFYDYNILLKNIKPDILSVCTPADSHTDIVYNALKNKVKLIFAEKPLALSLSEYEKIINAQNRVKSIIFVNHSRRFSWDWRQLKEMLDKKIIGDLLFSKASFSGRVLHTGTHMFDMLNYLFGLPRSIEGEFFSEKGRKVKFREDCLQDGQVRGVLEYKNRHLIFIDGMQKEYFQFEMEINGTLGRIRIGNQLHELWLKKECAYAKGFYALEKVEGFKTPLITNPWITIGDEIIDALENNRGDMLKDAKSAYLIGRSLVLSSFKNKKLKFPVNSYKNLKINSY